MPQCADVSRDIDAPLLDVYRSWTEPAILRTWLAAIVECDLRVGGAFRLENRTEDGVSHAFVGTYRAIEHGRRLAMTFGVADGAADGPTHETLELAFTSISPLRTRVSLTNCWSGTLEDEDVAGVREGWQAWLEMNAALFAEGQ